LVVEMDGRRRTGLGAFEQLVVGRVLRAGEDRGEVLLIPPERFGRRLDAGAGADAELTVDLGREAHGPTSLHLFRGPYPRGARLSPWTARTRPWMCAR